MNAQPIEQRYFTLKQAGQYCGGKSAEAMRMMARHGKIPVIKLGKSLLIDRIDLDNCLKGLTVKPE